MTETIAAAEHTTGGLPWWVWLILAALTAAAYKVGEWRWRPFAPCWCCKGSGKHHRKDRKVFRDCWWCRGSGRRKRIGRRVWDRFAKVRNAAR
ncbi:hypothetical protein [Micromonospora sp. L32]|uniref:hypothetical protein n=1 Tax=Micromonospora sp. L32 TaxID=3452214 RepID=UPI003F8A9429